MFDLFITKSIAIWDALERFRACMRAIWSVCVILVVWAVVRVCELVWGVSECAASGCYVIQTAPAGLPVGLPRGRFPVVFNLVDKCVFFVV